MDKEKFALRSIDHLHVSQISGPTCKWSMGDVGLTSVLLQSSTSDQQPSSMALSPHSGFTITAERDETTTTLLTCAWEHALRTFMVPVTAGASSSTCSRQQQGVGVG